ncbi:MAG TPA: glycosyltransferase [Rhizomicrobium sp.]
MARFIDRFQSRANADADSPSVGELIALADKARDGRAWELAAQYYDDALKLDGKLAHIWVQYGHALKETDKVPAALKAYRTAIELERDNADTYLQLGHALKILGNLTEAASAYSTSYRLDPSNGHAETELRALGWSTSDLQLYGSSRSCESDAFVELEQIVSALRDAKVQQTEIFRRPTFLAESPAANPVPSAPKAANVKTVQAPPPVRRRPWELLDELDGKFANETIPLTRYMVQAWHRFDKRREFHLNSNASRLQYIKWYYWYFLPTRPDPLCPPSPRLVAALNQPVNVGFGALTKFTFAIWRDEFRSNPDYDIFAEAGYLNFLAHLAGHEYPARRIPDELFPDFLLPPLNAPFVRDRNHPLSKGSRSLWSDSKATRDRFSDLNDWRVRAALNFEQILETGSTRLIASASLNYWRSRVLPDVALSHFAIVLATLSGRFGVNLLSVAALKEHGAKVAKWFDQVVVPGLPGIAMFSDSPESGIRTGNASSTSRARPRRNTSTTFAPGDRSEEIDLLVIGPLGAVSGLGTGTRRSISALERTGCNFRLLEQMYDNPSSSTTLQSARSYKGEIPRAVLWHINAEYVPDVMSMMPAFSEVGYNIGYFFWETETMPLAHALATDMLDEIWVPSEFVRRCYSAAKIPVVDVGTSVELPPIERFLGRDHFGFGDECVFVFTFDGHSVIHRKNPAGVVRAFNRAFPKGNENVRLVIKAQNLMEATWGGIKGRNEELFELCCADPRIELIDRTMSLTELYSLKQASDCYVSLHRSEGFGYGPAEAMALGKPVIMTNYSANTEFATADNCLLVDAPLVHVEDGEYLYWTAEMVWADPDIDQAAALMRRVSEDRAWANAIGMRARETINRDFGRDAMAGRYVARLTELGLNGNRGQGLLAKRPG